MSVVAQPQRRAPRGEPVLAFRAPAEAVERLKAEARAQGVSYSTLIRQKLGIPENPARR